MGLPTWRQAELNLIRCALSSGRWGLEDGVSGERATALLVDLAALRDSPTVPFEAEQVEPAMFRSGKDEGDAVVIRLRLSARLAEQELGVGLARHDVEHLHPELILRERDHVLVARELHRPAADPVAYVGEVVHRSEERRVGKEGVRSGK